MLSNFQKSCEHLDRPQHQVKHWHQAPLRLKPVGDLERNVRNACCWVCPSSSGTSATCNGPTGIPRVWMATSSAWWGAWTTSMYCLLLSNAIDRMLGRCPLMTPCGPVPQTEWPRVFGNWKFTLFLTLALYWCASCVAGSLAWTLSNQELLGCLSAFSIWAYYLELCETNISL